MQIIVIIIPEGLRQPPPASACLRLPRAGSKPEEQTHCNSTDFTEARLGAARARPGVCPAKPRGQCPAIVRGIVRLQAEQHGSLAAPVRARGPVRQRKAAANQTRATLGVTLPAPSTERDPWDQTAEKNSGKTLLKETVAVRSFWPFSCKQFAKRMEKNEIMVMWSTQSRDCLPFRPESE